jgi:hypothetical protein
VGAALTAHLGYCSGDLLAPDTPTTQRAPCAPGSGSRRLASGPYSPEPFERGGAGAGPPPVCLLPIGPPVVVTTAGTGPPKSQRRG